LRQQAGTGDTALDRPARRGAAAWAMWSQQAQAFLRRMWRITLKALSMMSSCSETSSPSGLSSPPHCAQACS